MTTRGYRYLDHTADILVEAWGRNVEEAFAEAARAMFDAMTDLASIRNTEQFHIEVTGHDTGELLYNWLEELLFQFETENRLGHDFQVCIQSSQGTDAPLWHLSATIHGDQFEPQRHPSKVGIKAITYSHLQISSSPDKYRLQFLLDI